MVSFRLYSLGCPSDVLAYAWSRCQARVSSCESLDEVSSSVRMSNTPRIFRSRFEGSFDIASAAQLHDLAKALFDAEQFGVASKFLQWAVDIRRLICDRQSRCKPDLADSLHLLDNCLFRLGRSADGIYFSREAVRIRRALEKQEPGKYAALLSTSFYNLSANHYHQGDSVKAIKYLYKSVGIRRKLAHKCPEMFQLLLAESLHSLSFSLLHVHRYQFAISIGNEALDLYRKLEQASPGRFTQSLSSSLKTVAIASQEIGRPEDAVKHLEEVIQIYLSEKDPEDYDTRLADAKHELGTSLYRLHRVEEAICAIEEAIRIRRKLPHSEGTPGLCREPLSSSLYVLAVIHQDRGDHSQAVRCLREVIGIRRELSKERPNEIFSLLADSLHGLAVSLCCLEQFAASIEPAEEAIELRRKLECHNSGRALAASLHCIAIAWQNQGDHENAVRRLEEAITLRKDPPTKRPELLSSLAESIDSRGFSLFKLGRHQDSLAAAQEALEIRRELYLGNNRYYRPQLALSLHNVSIVHQALGEYEASVRLLREAVGTRRILAKEDRGLFEKDLVDSLESLAHSLSQVDLVTEATEVFEEALVTLRSLEEIQPGKFKARISASLHRLLNIRSKTSPDDSQDSSPLR